MVTRPVTGDTPVRDMPRTKLETQAHKKLHPRSAPRSVDAMKPPAAGASGSADAPRGEAPPLFGHEEPLARLLIRAAVAP